VCFKSRARPSGPVEPHYLPQTVAGRNEPGLGLANSSNHDSSRSRASRRPSVA